MRKTNPLHLLKFGLQRTAGPYSWVKLGKAQGEHMFSAVHPITDITKLERHVRKVPKGDIALARRLTQRQYTLSSWHGSFDGPSRTYKTSRTIWLTRQIGVANSGLHSVWSALG